MLTMGDNELQSGQLGSSEPRRSIAGRSLVPDCRPRLHVLCVSMGTWVGQGTEWWKVACRRSYPSRSIDGEWNSSSARRSAGTWIACQVLLHGGEVKSMWREADAQHSAAWSLVAERQSATHFRALRWSVALYPSSMVSSSRLADRPKESRSRVGRAGFGQIPFPQEGLHAPPEAEGVVHLLARH